MVNVGSINAEGRDLGKISLNGDLGQIDAGDSTTSTPGLVGLTAQSLGRMGLTTQRDGGSLESNITGKLGSLTVKSILSEATMRISGGTFGQVGAVTIGGTLSGGSAAESGAIFAAGDIGPVKLGALRGGAGAHSGSIESGGKIASVTVLHAVTGGTGVMSGCIVAKTTIGAVKITGDWKDSSLVAGGNVGAFDSATALAIGSIKVTGDVEHARVMAGYDRDLVAFNRGVQIGKVTVGGDWIASDLVAGIQSTDAYFGNQDDVTIAGGNVISKIASIIIAGQVLGSTNSFESFGFTAQSIGTFKLGSPATSVPLTAGKDTFVLGATANLLIREVP